MLELRVLYFEDLTVGMSETLSKTVAASDVVGFAQVLAITTGTVHGLVRRRGMIPGWLKKLIT